LRKKKQKKNTERQKTNTKIKQGKQRWK